MLNFDFLWGAATSSHQVEGNNIHNDWWHWEQQGNIETKELSGRSTDHWRLYKEDLKLAKEMGLNSYRFSVEWSRVEPREGHWDLSALEWYQDLIAECEKLNLVPMLTLHHFTVPLWFYERGGFTWEHSPERFMGYVRKVVRALGNRVPLWCTLNEPMNWVLGQYIAGYMPPAEFAPPSVSIATRNLLKSHVKAYDFIHSELSRRQGPWRHHPLMVGIAHNMIDFLPSRTWHPMERLLTQVLRRFYNQSWLDAVTGAPQHFGINGLVPYAKPYKSALKRNTVDFIGINYYTKAYLRWRARGPHFETSDILPIGLSFTEGNEEKTQMGWAVHPEGLARMIRFVKNYHVPILITENGIATLEDEQRQRYIQRHVDAVMRERKNGADIRGYYYWSLLDNFEWIKGFTPRFGLIEVDYKTLERKVRPSGLLFKQISELGKPISEGHLSTEFQPNHPF